MYTSLKLNKYMKFHVTGNLFSSRSRKVPRYKIGRQRWLPTICGTIDIR
jgi:hypothetical protein